MSPMANKSLLRDSTSYKSLGFSGLWSSRLRPAVDVPPSSPAGLDTARQRDAVTSSISYSCDESPLRLEVTQKHQCFFVVFFIFFIGWPQEGHSRPDNRTPPGGVNRAQVTQI